MAVVYQGGGTPAFTPPYLGPAAAPAAPSGGGFGGPTITTHTSTPVGGVQPVPGGTTVPAGVPTGGGFTGTPTQSATAAYVAGLDPSSPDWVTAVQSANANGGVIPGVTAPPPTTGHSIYDTDPAVAAAKAREQLGIPAIDTQLQSLIDRIVGSYGDPSIAAEAGFGLDPQGAAFAQQNYLSGNATLARIDQSHKQNLQKVINTLAGHGLLFSGDTGYQTGLENQSYGNNVYDAQQAALGQILTAIQSAVQQKQQLEDNLTSATEGAFNTYAANPEAYGGLAASMQPAQPQASASPAAKVIAKATTTAKKKTAAKALPNPYVTGQKLRG